MTGLLVLMPIALLLGVIGLCAFLWSLKSGQYDDMDGAGERILQDDGPLGGTKPGRLTRPGCAPDTKAG